MSALQSLVAGLRQLRYPEPFRISEPPWPEGWEAALTEALAAPAPPHPQPLAEPAPAAAPVAPEAPAAPDHRWLAELGTGLWRLRQRMVEPGTDRPKDEMRRAFRHMESLMDVARAAGLEIQDHTEAPYHSGMALHVLAFQPTPGVHREKVGETIKPTIYLNGTMIQMGEVIVATPETQR
jgi:hypothetical protein